MRSARLEGMGGAATGAGSARAKELVEVNPLEHAGWDALVAGHFGGTFFHGGAWARVLTETYGHCPVYVGRFADGQLAELLPVMEVYSFWTGRRGVSLPFTDFCAPLRSRGSEGDAVYKAAREQGVRRGWRYLECRGSVPRGLGAMPSITFYGHVIDLQGGPEAVFRGFDGATRRGIRKGQNAGLRVEMGTDMESVRIFYGLHSRTRRRHGLPPQPFRFFENIGRHVLEQGKGGIFIARAGAVPVAGAVFFEHGRQALYKFGASDYGFQGLRPNNVVMWEAIQRYAGRGFEELDLGRTSLTNEGLRRFKVGFGACERRIEYSKYDYRREGFVVGIDRAEGWYNRLFKRLPLPLLRLAGNALYPHLS